MHVDVSKTSSDLHREITIVIHSEVVQRDEIIAVLIVINEGTLLTFTSVMMDALS